MTLMDVPVSPSSRPVGDATPRSMIHPPATVGGLVAVSVLFIVTLSVITGVLITDPDLPRHWVNLTAEGVRPARQFILTNALYASRLRVAR
jgi:hypothetical protein